MINPSNTAGLREANRVRRLPRWHVVGAIAAITMVVGATAGVGTAAGTLPPAKQVIENRYVQAQTVGQQSPAPKDPVGARPADQPGSLPEGIIGATDSPFPATDLTVLNRWQGTVNGQFYVVYAGFSTATPNQGVVVVVRLGAAGSQTTAKRYLTPVQAGGLTVTSEQGTQVSLLSKSTVKFVFDFVAGRFITAPSCALTASGTNAQGQTYIQVTVQGTQAGLQSITITTLDNSKADVPPYQLGIAAAGTTVATPDHPTAPVVVTATKINQSLASHLALSVADVVGGITTCDPVLTQLSRGLDAQVFSDLSDSEHMIRVQNQQPGLSRIEVIVNGRRFGLNGLNPNDVRTLDVAAAMRSGAQNTIILVGFGPPQATAQVLIWDGSGTPQSASTGLSAHRHVGRLQQHASASTSQDEQVLQWAGGETQVDSDVP